MLVEHCASADGFTADADTLEVALVAWEEARGARFIYSGMCGEYIIASGRGGLSKWLGEQGYDADQSEWELVPPETPITITCDAEGNPCSDDDPECVEEPVTRTAQGWLAQVKDNGPLCGEDW
jgi:hypothetical protein